MPPSCSRCSPGSMASTRANGRDCARRRIPSSSSETPGACESGSLGFGWPNSEPDVDAMVREAAQRLTRAGATVTELSIPLHRDGIHIWNAIAVEGATMLMVAGNSMGTNWKGHYTTSLLDFYGRSRRARANDLSETVKLVILLGQYMQDNYQGRYYAKAQNLAR